MQIPVGIILDRFPFRRAMVSAMLCVSIGSLIFGFTHSLGVVIVARILMGIGSAFAFVGYVKMLNCLIKPKNISLWIGVGMTVAMLGAVTGQAPWLYVVEHLINWKTAYLIAGGFGILMAIIAKFLLPKNLLDNSKTTNQNINIKEQILKIIRQKNVWLLVIFLALLSGPLTSFVAFWAVPFFTHGWGITKIVAASAISVAWIGGLFAGPLLGFLADYFKHKVAILVTAGLIASLIMLWVLFIPTRSLLILTSLFFLLGLVCNGIVVIFGMISEEVSSSVVGFSMGWANTFTCLSGPFFQTLTGGLLTLIGGQTVKTLADYSLSQFQWSLVIIPILLLCYSLFFLTQRRRFAQ